jgi:molybdenum cofactor cytidylyltransferase
MKGRVLSAEDLAHLRTAGLAEVMVARLEPGDVPEDEAAAAAAQALAGPHVDAGHASTGRANLKATCHGLALVDTMRIERLNGIHESLTAATLFPFTPISPGDMVATVKVIPFAAPRGAVERWAEICREVEGVLDVAPFVTHRVGLITTRLPGLSESILERAVETLQARIVSLGSRVDRVRRCGHDPTLLSAAIQDFLARQSDFIMVVGASATVDRRDVVPAAIELAGGTIDHFGLPIDPGNLLLLGRCQGTTVVGVPGCARSPKRSGFDRILERLMAGISLTEESIAGMGVGGLMKEIPSRPLPRTGLEGRSTSGSPPRIGAVVLAAGASERMGATNKLLAPVGGSPMLARVVDALVACRARPIVVVTGYEAQQVSDALAGSPIRLVHNPDYAQGLSTSLRAGLSALEDDIEGAVIALGDMPWVSSEDIDALIDAFEPQEGHTICVPVHDHKRGNPILWSAHYFDEMKRLEGDVGARHLLAQHDEDVCEVRIDNAGVLRDVDTQEALDRGP